MQAFKIYFRILKKGYMAYILIYLAAFSLFAIVLNSSSDSRNDTEFSVYKCNVFVDDEDLTDISASLTDYIRKNMKVIDLDSQKIDDAIFFRKLDAKITIPKGFAESFYTNNSPDVQVKSISASSREKLIELSINSYLNTYRFFYELNPTFSHQMISDMTDSSLSQQVMIENNQPQIKNHNKSINNYYNYTTYIFLSISILCIASIISKMNALNISGRNDCSPKNKLSFTFEYLLANLVFILVMWLVFNVIAFVIYPYEMFSISGIMYFVNTFAFCLICLNISVFIGYVCKHTVINFVSICLSLAYAFLGGAFVPQKYLGDLLMSFAKFIPSYWYVANNYMISNMRSLTSEITESFLFNISIQLAFSFAIMCVSLVVIKYKIELEKLN